MNITNIISRKNLTGAVITLLTFFSLNALAIQEFETVVTDKKFNSSSSVVIDKKEIEKSRAKNLTTLLATQANISITQSNFQPNSIYLRGGDSSHVLILVDGVPFYDATTVQRTINLNSLNLKSIQRIEVIKGSQSVLFGGQALSGVIKIETIPPELKTSGQVLGQIGTQESLSASGNFIRSINETSAVVVRASHSQRKNESPVFESNQKYPTKLGTAELGYVTRDQKLETLIKAYTSFDKTFIASSDYPIYNAVDADNFETSTYQMNFTGRVKLTDNYFDPVLSVALQKSARNYEQQFVALPTKQEYQGELLTGRFEVNLYNTQVVKVLGGISATQEKLVYHESNLKKSDDSVDFAGAFLKTDVIVSDLIHLEGGVRQDIKKNKDQVATYQAGLTLFEKLKAEYSTGFKQPSMFQLYSSYGNRDLAPEKSTSFSLSFEQNPIPDFFYSVTYFDNQFTNLIVTRGSPIRYENVSKSKTVGVELATGYRFVDQNLTLNLALGYQEPRDVDANAWLVRRPLRTATFKVRKDYEKVGLGLEAVHNGDRRDQFGVILPSRAGLFTTIESYTYVNATAEYFENENLSYFIRGQNITDNRYQTSYDFYDEGSSVSVGAEATF